MLLIEPLFDGPVDIVGDVHGEIHALEDLLGQLGFDPNGRHAEGRRLVFVGDLTDRGPDTSGPDAQPVTPEDKVSLTAFLESLPLALERSDLRIVHACWNESAFAELREQASDCATVREAYERFAARIVERWKNPSFAKELGLEWRELEPIRNNRKRRPRLLPTIARMDCEFQMNNPVCVLTSGEETETDEPFWAGGKWRMVERVKWWERYDAPVPVVIGHYWRRFGDALAVYADKFGPDLFEGAEMHHCMGPRRNVYCVDFSVGGRYAQRNANEPLHMCRLAAVRVPEWQVVYDHGEKQNIDRSRDDPGGNS